MAILNPYLNFEGNAREAIDFYQSVFGGDVTVMAFGDMGMTEHEGNPIPADGVMHGQLTSPEGFTLMASDNVPGMSEGQTPNGHLSLSGPEDDLLRGYWDKLADGGRIDVPLEVAPWGDAFGQVKDKFGINWLVNIAGQGQQA
jgi:PhnB protein